MVLLVDQVGGLLILVEMGGQVVQALGHGNRGDAFQQGVDQRLFAQDQRDVVAENVHRQMEVGRQAVFVHRQQIQAQQDLGRAFVAGDLGELHAAEQQVIGVGGHALQ